MKQIRINYATYQLPEGMSAKDIQALVGFLSTLQSVDNIYSRVEGNYRQFHFTGEYARVQIVDDTESRYASQALAEAARDLYDEEVRAKAAADEVMADPED